VTSADLDGDGDLDLACANSALSYTVSVLLNQGNGTFATQVIYDVGRHPSCVISADLDDDGDWDLATANQFSDDVSVLVNHGNGTFATNVAYSVGQSPVSVTSADLDGDGALDLVGANLNSTSVSVLRNCPETGAPYCAGDGLGTACPCANHSPAGGNAGCLNSLSVGGTLRATGAKRISADTVRLQGARMPNAAALYFQGTSKVNGGAGVVFGDGLRCVAGSVVRLGTKINSNGVSAYPGAGDPSVSVRGGVTAPGERYYQVWYRNAAAFCTGATFNLTNALSIAWTL
jgi:hypothetical protein